MRNMVLYIFYEIYIFFVKLLYLALACADSTTSDEIMDE